MKEIIDELYFIKIENLCSAKDTVKRMRRLSTDWDNLFAKDIPDQGLFPRLYKSS